MSSDRPSVGDDAFGALHHVAMMRRGAQHVPRRAEMLARGEIYILQHGKTAEQAGDLEGPHQTRLDPAVRRVRAVMSRPSSEIVPLSGRRVPDNMPTNVVLPAPLGPISARRSPARSSRLMSFATTSAPKRLVRPLVESTTSLMTRPRRRASQRAEHVEDAENAAAART